MLGLKGITKDYLAGDTAVHALRGIDIQFRQNEFVAVLGPSGCGKTTLLNIIGGLDRYTEGDPTIADKSTKEYKDRDWDHYRNHTIGFVFQTYNLIPHQTVLSNVELALTLSGISKAERRERAVKMLERVGLGDQIKKKPNQMSGGQMQRVAIARALINDPEILLADEPTGALDTETSVQIMDLLKEIARDRLVIMVTHNPDLAEQYATRIIRLLDGKVQSDSKPYSEKQAAADRKKALKKKEKEEAAAKKKSKMVSMSSGTAFSLSLNNLLTKKGRTILTAFAGSIGIIGIALILSLSDGFQTFINTVQENTLSSYPLTIMSRSVDLSAL
ncbi:MAG: ABC transporter ATP-binding protein, partial [Oscillospiraceae bacterium]|nr:ABC transporter ATP-binding protein [Oscillospiraceae bacterium]